MDQIIARHMSDKNTGVDIKVYPGKSLFKPKEQWGAMTKGKLDMTAFPLAYAGGRHPEFNLTLMPGLVRNHDHARRGVQYRPGAVVAMHGQLPVLAGGQGRQSRGLCGDVRIALSKPLEHVHASCSQNATGKTLMADGGRDSSGDAPWT